MTSVKYTVPLAPNSLFINLFCNSRVSTAKVALYQVYTSQDYSYLQKHSGVPWTEIATLKRAFFVEPLGGGWWSETLWHDREFPLHKRIIPYYNEVVESVSDYRSCAIIIWGPALSWPLHFQLLFLFSILHLCAGRKEVIMSTRQITVKNRKLHVRLSWLGFVSHFSLAMLLIQLDMKFCGQEAAHFASSFAQFEFILTKNCTSYSLK